MRDRVRVSEDVAYSDAQHGAAPDTTDFSWQRGAPPQGVSSGASITRRGELGQSPQEMKNLRAAARANASAVQEAYASEPTGLAAMPLSRVFLIGVIGGAALVMAFGVFAWLFL